MSKITQNSFVTAFNSIVYNSISNGRSDLHLFLPTNRVAQYHAFLIKEWLSYDDLSRDSQQQS
jgi:hypothetical protein